MLNWSPNILSEVYVRRSLHYINQNIKLGHLLQHTTIYIDLYIYQHWYLIYIRHLICTLKYNTSDVKSTAPSYVQSIFLLWTGWVIQARNVFLVIQLLYVYYYVCISIFALKPEWGILMLFWRKLNLLSTKVGKYHCTDISMGQMKLWWYQNIYGVVAGLLPKPFWHLVPGQSLKVYNFIANGS